MPTREVVGGTNAKETEPGRLATGFSVLVLGLSELRS